MGEDEVKPYFEDGTVAIYHGDAREVLPLFGPESVSMTITSPPYNMGLTPGGNGRGMYSHPTQKAGRFSEGYDASSDALPPAEYAELLRSTLVEMWRVSRLAVWWNHRPRVIHGQLVDPLDGDFPIGVPVQRIILARPTGIDVSLRHFATRQEHLYLFAKEAFRLVDHAASGMGDVWPMAIPPRGDHPAPFDIGVPIRAITATAEADLILDPFMGSGTTLRAAKDCGRRAIGIDLSERYCEIAAERLNGPVRQAEGTLQFHEAAVVETLERAGVIPSSDPDASLGPAEVTSSLVFYPIRGPMVIPDPNGGPGAIIDQ